MGIGGGEERRQKMGRREDGAKGSGTREIRKLK